MSVPSPERMNLSDVRKKIESGAAFCVFSQNGVVTLATGPVSQTDYLRYVNRVPRTLNPDGSAIASISMIPFAQIKERDFEVVDQGEKIITIIPETLIRIPESDFFAAFPYDTPLSLHEDLAYNFSDETFADIVRDVIRDEIRNGSGSNFLISRKASGLLNGTGLPAALTVFSRLCRNEFGSYMTFCFFDGDTFFIGASPERHLSIEGGIARMSPISGTLPKTHADMKAALSSFVRDEKEINELFMVVDETLKMMMPLCPEGGEVTGPFLREMRALIHTENELKGRTDWDVVDAFRATMFAPTMVGSPISSACRVIYKHERGEPRRYYSSALMILGQDAAGGAILDSAITIRTMEMGSNGHFTIQSGASIVRDSQPEKEALEVRAKARGMMRAILDDHDDRPILKDIYDTDIESAMMARNDRLSTFWIRNQSACSPAPALQGKSILIVNNEDDFAHMIAHLLRHMGANANVQSIRDIGGVANLSPADLILLGPGPGDPTDRDNPTIRKLQDLTRALLDSRRCVFGVCLGHQVMCHVLGIPIARLPAPRQGVQKTVDLFGKSYDIGFYNTFAGKTSDAAPQGVSIAADEEGYIHALHADRFGSIQGHLESILSHDGYDILRDELTRLLKTEN